MSDVTANTQNGTASATQNPFVLQCYFFNENNEPIFVVEDNMDTTGNPVENLTDAEVTEAVILGIKIDGIKVDNAETGEFSIDPSYDRTAEFKAFMQQQQQIANPLVAEDTGLEEFEDEEYEDEESDEDLESILEELANEDAEDEEEEVTNSEEIEEDSSDEEPEDDIIDLGDEEDEEEPDFLDESCLRVDEKGNKIYADRIITPDGWQIFTDGSGSKIDPNGVQIEKNGDKIYPDGTVEDADGNKYHEDGTIEVSENCEEEPPSTIEESKVAQFYSAVHRRWGDEAVHLYKNYYLWCSQLLFGESIKNIGVTRFTAEQLKMKRIASKIDTINKYRSKKNAVWVYGGYVDEGAITSDTASNNHCAICGAADRYNHLVYDSNEIDFSLDWWAQLEEDSLTSDIVADLKNRASMLASVESNELNPVISAGINCTCDFYNLPQHISKAILNTQKTSVNEMVFLTPFIEDDRLLANALDDFDVATDILLAIKKYLENLKLFCPGADPNNPFDYSDEYTNGCQELLGLDPKNATTFLNFVGQFTRLCKTSIRLLFPRSLVLRVMLSLAGKPFDFTYRYTITSTEKTRGTGMYVTAKMENIVKILPYILNNIKSETDRTLKYFPKTFATDFYNLVGLSGDSVAKLLNYTINGKSTTYKRVLSPYKYDYKLPKVPDRSIATYLANYFSSQIMGIYAYNPYISIRAGLTTQLPEASELWARYKDLGGDNEISRRAFHSFTGLFCNSETVLGTKLKKDGKPELDKNGKPRMIKGRIIPEMIYDFFKDYPKTMGRFNMAIADSVYLNNEGIADNGLSSRTSTNNLSSRPYYYNFSRLELLLFIYIIVVGIAEEENYYVVEEIANYMPSVKGYFSWDRFIESLNLKAYNGDVPVDVTPENSIRVFRELIKMFPEFNGKSLVDVMRDIVGVNAPMFFNTFSTAFNRSVTTYANSVCRLHFGKPVSELTNIIQTLSDGVVVVSKTDKVIDGDIYIEDAESFMKFLLEVYMPTVDKAKEIIKGYFDRAYKQKSEEIAKIAEQLSANLNTSNTINTENLIKADTFNTTSVSNTGTGFDPIRKPIDTGDVPIKGSVINVSKYSERKAIIYRRNDFVDTLTKNKVPKGKEYIYMKPNTLSDDLMIDVSRIIVEIPEVQDNVKKYAEKNGELIVDIAKTVAKKLKVSDKQKYWLSSAFRTMCKHFEFVELDSTANSTQSESIPTTTEKAEAKQVVSESEPTSMSNTKEIVHNAEWDRLRNYAELNSMYLDGTDVEKQVNRIVSTARVMGLKQPLSDEDMITLQKAEQIIKEKIQAEYNAKMSANLNNTSDTVSPLPVAPQPIAVNGVSEETTEQVAPTTNADGYPREMWYQMYEELRNYSYTAKGIIKLRINSLLGSCNSKSKLNEYDYKELVTSYNKYCNNGGN